MKAEESLYDVTTVVSEKIRFGDYVALPNMLRCLVIIDIARILFQGLLIFRFPPTTSVHAFSTFAS